MDLYDEDEKEIRVQVRWMVRRDFPEVLAIERESFEFPWDEEDFLRCLQSRNCIGMVAEHEGRVVGFVIYETPKNKIFLTNIAVKPEHRQHGVARQIIQKLIGKLIYQNRSRLVIEIRETNLPALKCFRSLGFLASGILKNFYEGNSEDAYILQYQINQEQRANIANVRAGVSF